MVRIFYTQDFQDFLDKLTTEKQELIKETIKKYAEHAAVLPRPKSSVIHHAIEKVLLSEAKVVIFYVQTSDTLIILTGVELFDRAA